MSKLTKRPFLFRFAKVCISPSRYTTNESYRYDNELDMMRWVNGEDNPCAIHASGVPDPPMTKKADYEKGEDAKDQRMWL
ncbi:MAG: hypothetical protein RhofKO_08770 [Rhodothermales bacterium]